MLIVFVFAFFVLAAFALGVVVGPEIHKMIKACQDDVVNSGEGRGSLGSCFPKTDDLKYDPLIGQGDFWEAAKKPKRKGKGKRKGK